MLMWLWRCHWSFWIFFLLAILFLLWFFFGGKQQEFVGLTPLLSIIEDHEELHPSSYQEEEVCVEQMIVPSNILGSTSLRVYGDDEIPNIPPPKNPSKWRRQETCCRAIEEIFGLPFRRDVRDLPWLYNPETGANLELDCYNAELGVAVEHNGEHHYKYPNNFNRSREDWIAMVRRDKIKPDLCDRNGVYLVTIPHWIPFSGIKDEIRHQLEPLIEARNKQ